MVVVVVVIIIIIIIVVVIVNIDVIFNDVIINVVYQKLWYITTNLPHPYGRSNLNVLSVGRYINTNLLYPY